MAARKLKFKPKPSVGAAVRRVREKDDIELHSNELDTFNKNCTEISNPSLLVDENIPLNNSVTLKSEVANISTNVNACNSNNSDVTSVRTTNISQCKNITINCSSVPNENAITDRVVDLCHTNSDSVISDSSSPKCKVVPNSEFNKSKDIINIFENVPVKAGFSDSNLNSNSECISSTEIGSSVAVSETTKDLTTNNVSNTSVVKGDLRRLARFGRSRCKPVLNNCSTRKKNDAQESNFEKNDLISDSLVITHASSCDAELDTTGSLIAKSKGSMLINGTPANDSDTTTSNTNSSLEVITKDIPISNIRTDSVIKSVKEEIDKEKARALVEEIADSFSILESEETDITTQVEDHTETFTIHNNGSSSHYQPGQTHSFIFKPVPRSKVVRFADESECVTHLNAIGNSKRASRKLNANSSKYGTSPIKTTSKMLVPKPSPRISDMNPRRISFQGSDLEDEPKSKMYDEKELKRLPCKEKKRNNIKNNKRKRSHGSSYTQMGHDTMAKLSKRLQGDKPDKSKLTMIDLIFYNPKSNPMTVNSQPNIPKKKEEKQEVNELIEEILTEQSVDEVESTSLPVPQLKIGPNGEIMLDPKSLVIETTGMEKNRAKLENSEVIQENGPTRFQSYSKRKSTRTDWTALETLQFYKALNTIGSDFALMSKLFPKRSRHELKLKFKREEKANLHLIDKAMTAPVDFDFKSLEEELKNENEELERKRLELQKQKEAIKEARAKKKENQSKSTKKKKRTSRAFKDFEENESEVVPEKSHPKSYRRKRRTVINKKNELDESDGDLEIYLDSDSGSDDTLALAKMVKEKIMGNSFKRAKKLMEYEEINETLKKKMEDESDLDEDVYMPNGLDSHLLYGSPHAEDKHWDIEISSLPTIEQTVVMENIENVSELSELGSFGQNNTALDLSVPMRADIPSKMLEGNKESSMLNGHIIAESIQIIDQLTADVECGKVYNSQEDILTDASETATQYKEEIENKVVLPSFESVSRIRTPMLYPSPSSYMPENNPTCDTAFDVMVNEHSEPPPLSNSNDVHHITNESMACCISKSCEESERQLNHVNEPNIVLSNYYNESEECILGD